MKKKKKGERLRHEGQLFGIAKTFGRLWVETAEGCIAPMRLRVPRAPGVLGLYRRPLTAKTLSPRKSEKNTLAFYRAEAKMLYLHPECTGAHQEVPSRIWM